MINGRLISVEVEDDSSILAFSASSLSRCRGHGVAAQVNALVLLEFLGQPVDNFLVEIVAAEVGVAVGVI